MEAVTVLHSQLDKSINIVSTVEDGGFLEARFVQRTPETIIIYLSSMSGCDKACRFCHLTQTGQTTMTQATVDDYFHQAQQTFHIASTKQSFVGVKNVHFNFMARGDVIANDLFIKNHRQVIQELIALTYLYIPEATPRFKLSTIFPNDIFYKTKTTAFDIKYWIVDKALDWADAQGIDIEFYYSLYSLRTDFRKRWIPKSLSPEMIGSAFAGRHTGLRLHHALIAGQNDTEEDVALIHDWLNRHDLRVRMNIVRYNPYGERSGGESADDVRATYIALMNQSERVDLIQEIPRVGIDVKASCGTFFK